MNVGYLILALLFFSCTTSNSRLSRAVDYYNLANRLRDESELYQAMENYMKALELQPEMYAALYNLSLVRSELGMYEEALNDIALINKVDPFNLRIQRAMARLYHESGNYPEAREHYLSVLAVSEGDQKALAGLAETAEAMSDFDEAVRLWEQLVDINPGIENLIELAEALAMRGDYKLAISRYAQVLIDERDNLVARKGIAESARKDSNYPLALEYLSEGLVAGKGGESNPELWWHMSLIYILDLQDYEKGLEFFRLALAGGYPDEEILLTFIEERENEELRRALSGIRESIALPEPDLPESESAVAGSESALPESKPAKPESKPAVPESEPGE